MAVNDLWEIAIRGSCMGQPTFNVFHYQTTSEAGGAPSQATIASTFQTKIQAPLIAVTNQLYTIVQYTVQLRIPAGGAWNAIRGRLEVLAANVTGAGTSEVLPPQNSAYIRLYAEQSPGVYLKGGKFIGGIGEGASINGSLSAASLLLFQTLAGKMLENLTMGTALGTVLKPVIYSPQRHHFGPSPYVLPLTSYVVSPYIKTLRRRTLGTPVGGYL